VPKVGLDIEFKGPMIKFYTCTVKTLLLKRWKFVIAACLACYFKCIILSEDLGPIYMVSSMSPRQPSPRRRAFICENGFPTGRVKLGSASFVTLNEQSDVQMSLFLRVSLGHSITVGFAELIFTCLRQISDFFNTIHAEARQLAHPPSPPSPPRVCDRHVNGWLNFK